MAEEWKVCSVRVSLRMLEEVDEYRERMGERSQGDALRMLLASGLEAEKVIDVARERTRRDNARAFAMRRMRLVVDAAFRSAQDLFDSRLSLKGEDDAQGEEDDGAGAA